MSTAPIRDSDIVLGKFYALATLLFIPVAIISIYPLVLSAFGEISLAETYLSVGAFFLYGLSCITIGEFVSSITESQMIAAIISFGILFAGYVMNAMPKLYMVTGHGELEQDSDFTGILQKANIDTQTVNLMDYDAVPEDAMAVFVNAPTEDLSSDDAQKILNYLNNGGDIFINTAYTGKDMPNLNKLLDFYGVQVSKGLIIETASDSYYQDPFYLLPSVEYDTVTSDIYSGNSYIFAPYCQGLTFTEKEDVEVTPLLASSENSYMREDIENSTSYDKQEGDVDGPFYIGLSCTAQITDGTPDEQGTDELSETDVSSGDAANNESAAMIFSCENLFTQEADSMVAGTNQKLFSGVLQVLGTEGGESSSVVIPVKNYEVEYLTVSQSWISILALITVIVIPFGFIVIGFVIWFRRRKL